MARLGPLPMTAHARWDDDAVCLWAWDGASTASVGWLTGTGGLATTLGSHRLDLGNVHGSISRIEIPLPEGSSLVASCLRLRPVDSWSWFVGLTFCDDDLLSPSLQWFRSVSNLAEAVVHAGRIRPRLTITRRGQTARWYPVDGHDLDDAVGVLERAAPTLALPLPPAPSLLDGASADTRTSLVRHIVDTVVDGIARSLLDDSGWRSPLSGQRHATAQMMRSVFVALSSRDATVKRGNHRSPDHDLVALERRLERDARRAAGDPLVDVRLRLVLPDDADEAWPLVIEVIDDAGRWCTAADVDDRNALAVEIAGGEERVDLLAGHVRHTALTLADELPVVAALSHPSARDGRVGGALLDIDEVAEFLATAPPVLERLGIDLIGPEALVRARASVRGTVREGGTGAERAAGLTARALVDWSVVVSGDEIDGARITDEELARAEAAGVALLQVGGRWVQLDGAQLERARRAIDEHRGAHSEVDALTLLRLASASSAPGGEPDDVDVLLEAELRAAESAGRRWIGDLLTGLPDDALVETVESPHFHGELRHYQRRGLSWLQFLARLGLGGVLADDMGLGKTATTLAHLLERPGPHLVVCPLSVVRNWQNESGRFAPSFRVHVHHGPERHRHDDDADTDAADGNPDALTTGQVLADHDLVITTYGLVARDITHLMTVPWSTVVLDEAQMVKNPATRAARAVKLLRSDQVVALTGTPVENHLTELWSILDIANPGMLGTQGSFRERFAKPIERQGDEATAQQLRRLTQPFVLRRTKADRRLLPDLPDKVEQIAWATLTREQTAMYEGVVEQLMVDAAAEQGMKRRGIVLAALTRLKQICNHPAHALADGSRLAGRSGKLARFDELVDELLDADEQALVFTQFREMGELLQRHLAERLSMNVPFLHGGVPRARRDALVDQFQNRTRGDGTPPLLLVSLKAGGTGLNLTAASRVIHYDRWWNPAVEDQASDRAWRIGQTRTVFVHKLVCEGTVEEKIGRLIDDKRALADAVVGSGEAWLSELDTDQLRDLVRLERSDVR